MVQQHTFPQDGDYNDAAHFAQLIGHDILSDYVVSGLDFDTVDYADPTVSVTSGVCTISKSSTTAAQSGKSILSTTFAVQLPAQTVTLTDNTVNYLFVDPQFGQNDSATIRSYTDASNAPAVSLRIGSVDTGAQTTTVDNREPTFEGTSIVGGGSDVSQVLTDTGSNTAGGTEYQLPAGEDSIDFQGTGELTGLPSLQVGGSAVLTDADTGSGNGLDADQVDGANVYVQSSEPSDGSQGDLWFDTS